MTLLWQLSIDPLLESSFLETGLDQVETDQVLGSEGGSSRWCCGLCWRGHIRGCGGCGDQIFYLPSTFSETSFLNLT